MHSVKFSSDQTFQSFQREMERVSIVWYLIAWNQFAVNCWNLATYDDTGLHFITKNDDYQIVHVSLFYVRAFLTIRNCGNSTDR